MADNKIKVEILTPERPLAEEEATEVNFPATDGYMGILPDHTPLVAELGIGEVVGVKDGQEQRFMVNGGFAQVAPDRVTLMANEAQASEDIDRAQAEADLKQSEADLLKAELPEEVDAALDLAKTAETRINLS
ncbi:MAG: ATP synthase F1 subunit epsilon [Actinomycetia bacterium]|nr:ATP synthase F1 subunit epsilon [Actinomycetes bacterium]